MNESSGSSWVLYDGECSFCVEFVDRWKPALLRHGFQFETLQTTWVREKLGLAAGEVPEEMKILFPDGSMRGGADAVLFLASQIWWMRPSVWIARLPGIFQIAERSYKRIALHRRCRIERVNPDEEFHQEIARTTRGSAILGAIAAAAANGYSAWRGQFSTLLFFLSLAPLVLVPLALRAWALHGAIPRKDGLFRWAVLVQPLAAAAALVSMLFGRGPFSASLAVAWFAFTALLAIFAILRLLRGPIRGLADLTLAIACLFLPVGGIWLLFTRLGVNPFDIEEPIATLTAIHFHYSGFIAPTLLALFATRFSGSSASGMWKGCVAALFCGIVLIALGFLGSPAMKLFGVLALCASLAPLGVAQLLAPSFFPLGRSFVLRLAGLCLIGGMALAAMYEIGNFLGGSRFAIDQMAIYHGTVNGLGFSLLSLLAWQKRPSP